MIIKNCNIKGYCPSIGNKEINVETKLVVIKKLWDVVRTEVVDEIYYRILISRSIDLNEINRIYTKK